MNKTLTEIIYVLDRSGSMGGLEHETIGGYNGFLTKQAAYPGQTIVTTVLFDDQYEILYNGRDAREAALDASQYFVRGYTALYDAVGKTILDVGARLAATQEKDRPGKVIFVITTDGQENASREFSQNKVRELITHQRRVYNWEFLFFGANIDTAREAENIGIARERAVSFKATPKGMQEMMCCMCDEVKALRGVD